jgi:hypothetical protein
METINKPEMETKDHCVDCKAHRSTLTEIPWGHGDGILCKPCRRLRVAKQIEKWEQGDMDHSYTDEIVCPYCGSEQGDSWELSDDSGDLECGNCDKEFTYERDITVNYTTSRKE